MSPHRLPHRPLALVGAALATLAITVPVTANAPERSIESDTSISCQNASATGVIRLVASVSSLSGPSGFLLYWDAGADPSVDQPTLASNEVDVTVGANGTVTATYGMHIPGDLGLEGDGEPIFVGTAELTATIQPSGEIEDILERNQIGNSRTVQRGARQALTVTGGAVTVPTGGTFALAGAGCEGRRQTVGLFSTQPDASVSTGHLIELDCFFETADGFVGVSAQSGATDTYLGAIVVSGSRTFFGEATDPEITLRGVDGTVMLSMEGDPSVSATVDVSARFDVVERGKGKFDTETGWAMETGYLLSVDGTLSIDGPGLALDLPLDGCFVGAQTGISHSH